MTSPAALPPCAGWLGSYRSARNWAVGIGLSVACILIAIAVSSAFRAGATDNPRVADEPGAVNGAGTGKGGTNDDQIARCCSRSTERTGRRKRPRRKRNANERPKKRSRRIANNRKTNHEQPSTCGGRPTHDAALIVQPARGQPAAGKRRIGIQEGHDALGPTRSRCGHRLLHARDRARSEGCRGGACPGTCLLRSV